MLIEPRFQNTFKQTGNKWIIPGVLPQNALVMISGKAGSGKSFLMVDLLASIYGYGESVLGTPEMGTGLLACHVCLESPGDMFRRYIGVEAKNGHDTSINGITDFDLTNRQECKELADTIAGKARGIGAIGWSTFNRLAPGVDENSTADMTMVWNNLDLIRKITGMTQIIEHHTALGSDRPRGSSVTDGVLHTLINVAAIKGDIRISCKKQRNGKPFDPVTARIVDVPTPQHCLKFDVGPTVPVLQRVVKGSDGSADAPEGVGGMEDTPDVFDSVRRDLTGNARRVLDYAETNDGVSWRDMEPLQLMSKKTFYRAIDALEDKKLIVNMGNGNYVTMEDI